MLPLSDPDLLSAALEGLEAKRDRIIAQIAEVKAALGSAPAAKPAAENPPRKKAAAPKVRKKRTLTPEARERIAAAQKRRWDAFRAAPTADEDAGQG